MFQGWNISENIYAFSFIKKGLPLKKSKIAPSLQDLDVETSQILSLGAVGAIS